MVFHKKGGLELELVLRTLLWIVFFVVVSIGVALFIRKLTS